VLHTTQHSYLISQLDGNREHQVLSDFSLCLVYAAKYFISRLEFFDFSQNQTKQWVFDLIP
jgi:hypothetical protein